MSKIETSQTYIVRDGDKVLYKGTDLGKAQAAEASIAMGDTVSKFLAETRGKDVTGRVVSATTRVILEWEGWKAAQAGNANAEANVKEAPKAKAKAA